MNKGKLERIRVQDFIPTVGKREFTVIFDFDDDWHCALNLKAEMSKTEVARILMEISHLILAKQTKEAGR